MCAQHSNNYPKLHNAMWPGLVGKGSPGAEPCIDLDTMLDLTARAEVDGVRFDGVDIFLYEPHISIDVDQDGIKRLADKVSARGFVVGSVVAPVWGPTGGGPAMGTAADRQNFVGQVRKACRIAKSLRDLGIRPNGVVRIDSASGVTDWTQDPDGNQQRIAQTFAEACDVAESFGERLAAEGEICWGGMHSWKKMVDLLERVNRPRTLGFQADMAHTLLYILGYNAPEDALLPQDWDWSDPERVNQALKTLTNALRPWTVDFHVAQNDATVKGSGTHDKTGHHCLPNDPNGKLTIPAHAGFWLRTETGQPSKAFRHICWDGCMFPNTVMGEIGTWNDILSSMIAVRDAHGWNESDGQETATTETLVEITAELPPPAPLSLKPLKPSPKSSKPRLPKNIDKRVRVKEASRPAKRTPLRRRALKRLAAKVAKPKRASRTKRSSARRRPSALHLKKSAPAKKRSTAKVRTKRKPAARKSSKRPPRR
jgi:sugar phosphate isomerase/epimerase